MKGFLDKNFEDEIILFLKGVGLNVKLEYIEFSTYSWKGEQISIKIKENISNQLISYFDLIAFPGCCGIIISTGVHVNSNYRNLGIGQFLHKIRITLAKHWGYSLLLCTDVDTNSNQKHILEKNNWKLIDQFINSRTNNLVNIHTLKL